MCECKKMTNIRYAPEVFWQVFGPPLKEGITHFDVDKKMQQTIRETVYTPPSPQTTGSAQLRGPLFNKGLT